jgi:hypothetical protein
MIGIYYLKMMSGLVSGGKTYNKLDIIKKLIFIAVLFFVPVHASGIDVSDPSATITSTAGANGSISPSGSVTVLSGTSKTFSITANTGYRIGQVVVDGVSKGALSGYTFTNITAGPHTISATFNPTITSSAGTGGYISFLGTTAVPSGGSKTYTITPKAGYRIAKVVVDGSSVGAVSTYTFTNVTTPRTISAAFDEIGSATITSTAGTGGSISPSGSVTVLGGTSKTFSITANTGYRIGQVVVDGVSKGALSGYTFTNITAGPHTISATFNPTITSSAGTGGYISFLGTTAVPSGGSKTYTITPKAGYRIAKVVVDGSSVGAVSTYTFTNVTTPRTISAAFDEIGSATITSTAGTGGSISPSGSVTVLGGTSKTFSITANTGYRIGQVVVDGVSKGALSGYTFTNITAGPHTISATFNPTITSSAGTGGYISFLGTTAVPSGGSKTYTITPKAGYRIAKVVVDGSSVGAVSTYTFTNVTTPRTISAAFDEIGSATITSTAGTGGSISPSGSVTVLGGTSKTFSITANTGYRIGQVVVDGVSKGALSGYTFTNITAGPHTISATFKPTITSSAGPGGTISPLGTAAVPGGGTMTYTIRANAGCRIADVLVAGSSVGAVSTYTFTNVTTPQTILATFVQDYQPTGPSVLYYNGLDETTALQSLLDAGGELDITGEVIFTYVTSSNSTTKLISSNSLGKLKGSAIYVSAKIEIDNVDLDLRSMLIFNNTPALNSSIKNINMYSTANGNAGYIFFNSRLDIDYAGSVFDNISNTTFYGKASGITIKNCSGNTGKYYDSANHSGNGFIKLKGRDNIIEYNTPNCLYDPICIKFLPGPALSSWGKSSKNNIIRYNTLSGAHEESLGWDNLSGAQLQVGHVSTVPALNKVTSAKDYGTALSGTNAVGKTLYLFSGNNKGRYFEVIAQTSGVLTLDQNHGATIGDYFVITEAFVANEIHDNTINMNSTHEWWNDEMGDTYWEPGYGSNVGISLWGGCFGNSVHHNTVNNGNSLQWASGIHDMSVIINESGVWRYGLNAHNEYYSNTINDAGNDDISAGIIVTNGPQWIGIENCPITPHMEGSRFTDNVINGTVNAYIKDVYNAIYDESPLAEKYYVPRIPSFQDDDGYAGPEPGYGEAQATSMTTFCPTAEWCP